MVAAGIGITPFVSQLRHARLAGEDRDIVLVYVASEASELAFRDELEASGVPGHRLHARPSRPTCRGTGCGRAACGWTPTGCCGSCPTSRRATRTSRARPALIADLAPALEQARSITTDAFSGY